MKPEEAIGGIIDDLYAGTLDDEAWQRTMIRVADLVGASGADLVSFNPVTKAVIRDESHRIDPVVGAAYRQHWSTKDILTAPFLRTATGEPTPEHKLVPRYVWEQSEIFNELALPHDLPYVLLTMLHKAPDKFTALSLKTSQLHGPYHDHEVQRLKIVVPHMRRALEVKDRLALAEIRTDSLSNSLNNLSFGVLILDARGRIIEASTAAQDLMRSDSGVRRNTDGTVWLREPAGTELYRWILAKTPPPKNTDGLLHVPRPTMQPISILVTQLPRKTTSWIAGDPRWMLLLFDPERRIQASTELIARDLGISAREAEIAALLVAGYDLANIASRLSISPNTVRTHVKTIFGKTGIGSQAELIRRIASGPSVISRETRRDF